MNLLDNENEIETEKLHKNQDLRIWSHNFSTWLNSHKIAGPICKYVYLFIWIHCRCIHWLDQYCALNRTSVVFNIYLHWLGVSLCIHINYSFIRSFICSFIYFDSVIIATTYILYIYRHITYSMTMLCTHHAVSHYSQLYSSVISDVISFYIH